MTAPTLAAAVLDLPCPHLRGLRETIADCRAAGQCDCKVGKALDAPDEWQGEGAPPASWWATDAKGRRVKVYRSYADYCDD